MNPSGSSVAQRYSSSCSEYSLLSLSVKLTISQIFVSCLETHFHMPSQPSSMRLLTPRSHHSLPARAVMSTQPPAPLLINPLDQTRVCTGNPVLRSWNNAPAWYSES